MMQQYRANFGFHQRCDFMDYCFEKIKTLPSECLTTTCGNFIVSYFSYEFTSIDIAAMVSTSDFSLPGLDTFWYFCLRTKDEVCFSQVSDILVWITIDVSTAIFSAFDKMLLT